MEYVRQIGKYTLETTEELTPEPVYYCVDNMTPEKVDSINKYLLNTNPTLGDLEFILANIDHDCNNLKDPIYLSNYLSD